jgi:hypothetical protein
MVSFYKKDFDTQAEKERYGRPEISTLPPGTYEFIIHRAEHFTNKAQTGKVLAITFSVVNTGNDEPMFAKEYVNYPHSNDTTDWHGRRQLRSLTDIVGGFHHHAELEGKRVNARVSVSEGERPLNQFEFVHPQMTQSTQQMEPESQEPPPQEKQFWG